MKNQKIKLLLTSVLEMDEKDFFAYAEKVSKTAGCISQDAFARKLLEGEAANITFPNNVKTSYEILPLTLN